jgi:formylglycine-generating enzyme required for sulfatase activity
MAKNPTSLRGAVTASFRLSAARRLFGELLYHHLFDLGTRPRGAERTPWTKEEFTGRLSQMGEVGTISLQNVEDWLSGERLPDEQVVFPEILQLVFGEDPAFPEERSTLVTLFDEAKRAERGVFPPQDAVPVGRRPSAGTAITSLLGTTDSTDQAAVFNPLYASFVARLNRDLQTLKAAKLPPDSVSYAETETSFAIVQGQATDVEVAAQPATAQRHRNVIAKIEDLIDACGTRLDNQRSWRRLPQIARRALAAADRPTIGLPDALVDLYDHTVSLGSYVSQDDAIGADRNASDAPLDHDIRRALVDFISSASPWLRGFPSVLAADDARRDFLTRPELFEPIRRALPAAREFLEIAGQEGVLSPEDAARATLPIETAERGGVLGEKAGYRGHGNALGLLTRAATVSIVSLISFYSGAIASDFATKSGLVQRAGGFLARAEEQALQLAASAPEDLRIALENVLKENRLRQEGDPPPQTPAIIPTDGSKSFRPPLEPFAHWRQPIPGLPEEAWPGMINLPSGKFLMGSPQEEFGSSDHERPQRIITVSNPPALGQTAVTFAMWDAAVKAGFSFAIEEDIIHGERNHLPVLSVSWLLAQAYCAWLNERLSLSPGTWRLPTEAEWEYGCRAGTNTPFSFGNFIKSDQVNYDPSVPYLGVVGGEFRGRPVQVGSLPPNSWGLHEMHGNVLEWVEDGYGTYPNQPTDALPLRGTGNSEGVLRGGSWGFDASWIRSAARYKANLRDRSLDFSFRLARTIS